MEPPLTPPHPPCSPYSLRTRAFALPPRERHRTYGRSKSRALTSACLSAGGLRRTVRRGPCGGASRRCSTEAPCSTTSRCSPLTGCWRMRSCTSTLPRRGTRRPRSPATPREARRRRCEVNTTRRAAGRRAAGAPLALPPSPRALQHASLHSLSLSRCPMDVRIARAVTQTQVLSIPSAAA